MELSVVEDKMEEIIHQCGHVPKSINTRPKKNTCSKKIDKPQTETISAFVFQLDSEINRLSKEYDQKLASELDFRSKLERKKSIDVMSLPEKDLEPPPTRANTPTNAHTPTNTNQSTTTITSERQNHIGPIVAKIEENKKKIKRLEKKKVAVARQSVFERLHKGQSSIGSKPSVNSKKNAKMC